MSRRALPLASLAVTAAVAIAGCGGGGGQSDKQAIEEAVTSYYKAFGSGDSETACNQLADETTRELEKAAAGKKCPQVLDQALKRPDYARVAAKLDGVKVTSVSIHGNQATATTEVPGIASADGSGVSTTVPLKKESGSWKIASTIGDG